MENRYVAVKVHEIASDWNEERKENFVRHAYRENSILRTLDHPRIVKCYDVSTSSFMANLKDLFGE